MNKPWSHVSSLLPPGSCLQFLSRIPRVQQSHCSSIFHRVLLTHALALSASQFVHKKKSPRIYSSMHSAGLELTKLTYTRLEDKLTRRRGDRLVLYLVVGMPFLFCKTEDFSYPQSVVGMSFLFCKSEYFVHLQVVHTQRFGHRVALTVYTESVLPQKGTDFLK